MGVRTRVIPSGWFADGIRPRLTEMKLCCIAFTTSPRSELGLSPEKELEFVKAPTALSFHASVNHFFAATSMNFFISVDMLPMQFGQPKMMASGASS